MKNLYKDPKLLHLQATSRLFTTLASVKYKMSKTHSILFTLRESR